MNNQIVVHRHGAIAEVVINRPEKMNAMTPEMSEVLAHCFTQLNDDEDIRVILLRGEGERAFCAGSDLKALDSYPSAADFRQRIDYGTTVRRARKPVVAALRGWVLGGGLEMMLAADIRIAGHGAKFGAPEVIRGRVGGGGASQFLPRLVGYGQSMRLLLSGDNIDAQEAWRIGLVEFLVADDTVNDTAMILCQKLAEHNPLAVQAVKSAVRGALSMPLEAGMQYENELTTLCFAVGNYQQGTAAFSKQRP
ncbi:enoyl-CoA hydratase/isomerase family protein [Escherichia coli]|uniref:enoyl-CoA hydratase/isomerase family protein n=1 Tax=Escherichia coli TaxID=562 RepID=UPI000854D164|nr:enoyl-CoA hydratase/isomerase family protein [Escherichia coli]EIG9503994.1 enoyl-CoA hydratase/isomerase family protein [Escherichia coli]MBF2847183.1 enoyl-CoA hydratase/isomerase family protein [Escherichia coli]MBF2856933.1 enoyl-CoA hydratase/isomerase family protein [Escherichia coli]MDA6217017.1 enoyl-CoA hydratase/isomerase family protein [Escherichia coli]MDI1058536.1 enoyl-CoA hydratase/isomerase family protein [Escherichia coli]